MQVEDVVAATRARPWAGTGLAWGQQLLDGLAERLEQVCRTWDLRIEGMHDGGVGVPVLDVRSPGGSAVLKLGHGEGFAQQCRILLAADGDGFVRVLDHDADLEALLLERLGAPLATTTPDPVAQTMVLAELTSRTWRLPLTVAPAWPPETKARQLQDLLTTSALRGGPHEAVLARAGELAGQLADSTGEQVVVHGDPHSLNALARGGAHALIDPDGFRCEAAYDLGVVLRDLAGPLQDLARTQGSAAASAWLVDLAGQVSHRHGTDPSRVLAWAFVERCTTGAYLHLLGYADEADQWLTTAALLLGHEASLGLAGA